MLSPSTITGTPFSWQTRQKVDPEDVVQSAFRSFFTRQAAGQFDVASWDDLWGLLVVITVRNGVVTSRTYFGTEVPVGGDAASLYPDIDGLFAFVGEAMEGDPFLLATEYDSEYGYPVSVIYDATAGTTSDNVTFTVEELTPVE